MALGALGELAGGVAHNVHHYLGLIVGHAELALLDALGSQHVATQGAQGIGAEIGAARVLQLDLDHDSGRRGAPPAPGDATLAERVGDLLCGVGLESRVDTERGLDHGAWCPLLLGGRRAPTLADGGVYHAPTAIKSVADADGKVELGGSYFAKWRLIKGEGFVEGETYVPDHCAGGAFCRTVP